MQVMTTFGRAFDMRRQRGGRNANKATDEQRHIKLPVLYKKFISMDRAFSTVIIDEAHEFRNTSANWYATLELTKSGRLPMLLTATPLFTSPQVSKQPYPSCYIDKVQLSPRIYATLEGCSASPSFVVGPGMSARMCS